MKQKEPGSVPVACSSRRLVSDVAPGDRSTASPLAHMAAGDVVVKGSEENVSAPSLAQEGCRWRDEHREDSESDGFRCLRSGLQKETCEGDKIILFKRDKKKKMSRRVCWGCDWDTETLIFQRMRNRVRGKLLRRSLSSKSMQRKEVCDFTISEVLCLRILFEVKW